MPPSRFGARVALASLLLAPLGACVPTGDAPSLAQRPFERVAPATPAAAVAPPPAATDPALLAHLADLERASVAADAAFRSDLPAVERAVRGAGGAGSESWTDAQQQVSALEAERGSDTATLAELDDTARTLEGSSEPTAGAGLQAVAGTVAAIQARDDEHGRQIEALARRLPS